MDHKKYTYWFTLVELIVVVTILAILATIGFVSYSSYLISVRDSNRLSQLVSIHDGLKLYSTTANLPVPQESVEIRANGELIAYQWVAWSNTLETIEFSKWGKDPKDGSYFSYYLTKNRANFQLLAHLEESDLALTPASLKAYANEYDSRIPAVYGSKLGVITDENNTPVQFMPSIQSVWEIDFWGTHANDNFRVHLENDRSYFFEWQVLNHKMYSISKPEIYGFERWCPDWFIWVPGDSRFAQKWFCVAQYEMSFEWIDTPDVSWRNAVDYRNNPTGKIQSKRWGLPITMLTQQQAIDACKWLGKGYHLITNDQWMTIARNIEFESENWSSGIAWTWFVHNWNTNSSDYGCQDRSPNASHGATTWPTTNTACNAMRKRKLSNSSYIWDLSWNVREHVNKANTKDGALYDSGSNSTIASWGSWQTHWDDASVSDAEKSDYGPLIIESTATNDSRGWWFVAPSSGTIFVRWASATSGTTSGLYDLLLDQSAVSYSSNFGFRCSYTKN